MVQQKDLEAGKRWVEQQFAKLCREYGTQRTVATQHRWRGDLERFLRMTFCIEVQRHVRMGLIGFVPEDLEKAGAGEVITQLMLESQMRLALESFRRNTDTT